MKLFTNYAKIYLEFLNFKIKGFIMAKEVFDFYDRTYLKSYNLDKSMRYQLSILESLDVFTRNHSENVANITCRLCKYLHCNKGFTEYCKVGS